MHKRFIQLWTGLQERLTALHAFRKTPRQTLVHIKRYPRYQYLMFQTIRRQIMVDKQDADAGQHPPKREILYYYMNIVSVVEFNHILYHDIVHRIRVN